MDPFHSSVLDAMRRALGFGAGLGGLGRAAPVRFPATQTGWDHFPLGHRAPPAPQPQGLDLRWPANTPFDGYGAPPAGGNVFDSFVATHQGGDNSIATGSPSPMPQRAPAGGTPSGFSPSVAALGRALMPSSTARRWT